MLLNFFRSEEDLKSWRASHREAPGEGVTLAKAFELGKATFGGLWPDRRR